MKLTISKMIANFDTLAPNEKLSPCDMTTQDETEVKILLVDKGNDIAFELCINEMERIRSGKVRLVHYGLCELVQDYLNIKKDKVFNG